MLLSLDLAYEAGFAIYDGNVLVKSGTLEAEGSTKYRKIKSMKDKICQLTQYFDIKEVVIEDIQLQKTVINGRRVDKIKSYKVLAEMRGAVLVMLTENGVKEKNITSYTASEWRAVHRIKQGRGVTREVSKEDAFTKYRAIYPDAGIDELEAILMGVAHIKKTKGD